MIVLWPGVVTSGGGGVCTPPTAPTLAVDDAGTVATITGGDAGSTHTVYTAASPTDYGTVAGTSAGSRTGNGTVSLTLASGQHWAWVIASNADGTKVSNLVFLRVGTASHELGHSPADVLRRVLIALDLGVDPSSGTSSNWPIVTGQEPDSPDRVVTTYDTDGDDFGRAQVTGERFEHYGVMLRVRSATQREGWVKAQALCVGMDQDVRQTQVTIDGTAYVVHAVSRRTRPVYNGREPQTGRHVHTINVTVNMYELT